MSTSLQLPKSSIRSVANIRSQAQFAVLRTSIETSIADLS